MKSFTGRSLFKLMIAFCFASSHAYAGAPNPENEKCIPKIKVKDPNVKACLDAAGVAQVVGNGVTTSTADGAKANADILQSNLSTATAVTAEAKQLCEKAYNECNKVCKKADQEYKDRCEQLNAFTQELQTALDQNAINSANTAETQSATSGGGGGGGGGGMNPMMAGLMGAALGGLAGYMLANKMNEDKNKKNATGDDDAILDNGQLDCSKSGAYKYAGCNAQLEAACIDSLDSETCQQFAGRYCGTSSSGTQTQSAGSEHTLGSVGEGTGTAFCKKVVATNYCKTSGRESCPSCLDLVKQSSPACKANPALCMAQNSVEQINQAKLTCPTDPAFSDPTYTAGGGAQVPTDLQAGGLPTVVLPQSADGFTNPAATVDAVGADMPAATSSSRDVASVGTGSGYQPSSASRGPVSDVAGAYAPSLFSTSASVIKRKCETGKLNCN